MSYILDALRRADQQRQRHAAPTLLTLQPSAVTRKRPAYLTYLFLAAVLIGAGLVIGWLRPWQPQQARTESVVVKPESTSPKSSANEPAPAPPVVAQQPNPEPGAQSATQPMPAGPAPSAIGPMPNTGSKPEVQARARPEADAPPRESSTTSNKTTTSLPERLAYTPAGDAPSAQPVIPIADLPQSVLQELPAMTISVHAWSGNPGGSMIGINYKIFREGDQVAPGLKLEQITQEGAIFTYKGYRFSRGVK
jgi:general secretion pathway protein B